MDGLEACVRRLDPATRALLDLSLRRRMHDEHMAPLLRIDPFNLAWRRARAIERVASSLGLDDPSGLAQVRAALPHLPERAWCVPLELEAGEPVAETGGLPGEDPDHAAVPTYDQIRPETRPTPDSPTTVDGHAETIEFDAVTVEPEPETTPEPEPETTPEHSWGPRTLAVRPAAAAPVQPPSPALPPTLRTAIAVARNAVAARPAAARGALLAGAGAILGALISRRRR
jgi:hypothetical protein